MKLGLPFLTVVAAAAVSCLAPRVQATPFNCRVSADGKSVEAVIANPFKREASCQVNCQMATARAGTTFQVSCSKTVAPGAGEVVLCTHTYDKGKLVKMVGGSGDCTNPEPQQEDADKDDDAEMEKAITNPANLRERVQKGLPSGAQMPSNVQKMLDQMNKP